ncbi:hypothetical protein Hamer_G021570, partial [Homarus americanus]
TEEEIFSRPPHGQKVLGRVIRSGSAVGRRLGVLHLVLMTKGLVNEQQHTTSCFCSSWAS